MAVPVKHDLVAVVVEGGDVAKAVKRFCSLWKNCGVSRELRFRTDNPSRPARRKAKAKTALRRNRAKKGVKT